jgi:hypothetical protein
MIFTLQYDGALADRHFIDFYDASRALAGFQRSLALITHLVVNGEVITQAPALKGAQIVTMPPEEGSWKTAAMILSAAFAAGSVGKDSPVGHIITSLYDYVLYETMGFHVDYDKTLQQQYDEHLRELGVTQSKVNSVMEKVQPSILDMHRPITASGTAKIAHVFSGTNADSPLGPEMNILTADYIISETQSDEDEEFAGVVSSYNINTFRGRFYLFEETRPIPFELAESCRSRRDTGLVISSLGLNDADRSDPRATVIMTGRRISTKAGRLKKILVNGVV